MTGLVSAVCHKQGTQCSRAMGETRCMGQNCWRAANYPHTFAAFHLDLQGGHRVSNYPVSYCRMGLSTSAAAGNAWMDMQPFEGMRRGYSTALPQLLRNCFRVAAGTRG